MLKLAGGQILIGWRMATLGKVAYFFYLNYTEFFGRLQSAAHHSRLQSPQSRASIVCVYRGFFLSE